jgi:hypothetical protein
LRTWRLSSSIHRPKPSAPALFEMMVRFFTPAARTSGIRLSGLPESPKPPDMIVIPSRSSPPSAARGES